MQKLKTIGDAYIVCCGAFNETDLERSGDVELVGVSDVDGADVMRSRATSASSAWSSDEQSLRDTPMRKSVCSWAKTSCRSDGETPPRHRRPRRSSIGERSGKHLRAMFARMGSPSPSIGDRHTHKSMEQDEAEARSSQPGAKPSPQQLSARRVVQMGLIMQQVVQRKAESLGIEIGVRVGVHTGKVIGGIIGTVRFHFDMWGAGVAGAMRMEEMGKKGRVHVSDSTAALLGDPGTIFKFEEAHTGSHFVSSKADSPRLLGQPMTCPPSSALNGVCDAAALAIDGLPCANSATQGASSSGPLGAGHHHAVRRHADGQLSHGGLWPVGERFDRTISSLECSLSDSKSAAKTLESAVSSPSFTRGSQSMSYSKGMQLRDSLRSTRQSLITDQEVFAVTNMGRFVNTLGEANTLMRGLGKAGQDMTTAGIGVARSSAGRIADGAVTAGTAAQRHTMGTAAAVTTAVKNMGRATVHLGKRQLTAARATLVNSKADEVCESAARQEGRIRMSAWNTTPSDRRKQSASTTNDHWFSSGSNSGRRSTRAAILIEEEEEQLAHHLEGKRLSVRLCDTTLCLLIVLGCYDAVSIYDDQLLESGSGVAGTVSAWLLGPVWAVRFGVVLLLMLPIRLAVRTIDPKSTQHVTVCALLLCALPAAVVIGVVVVSHLGTAPPGLGYYRSLMVLHAALSYVHSYARLELLVPLAASLSLLEVLALALSDRYLGGQHTVRAGRDWLFLVCWISTAHLLGIFHHLSRRQDVCEHFALRVRQRRLLQVNTAWAHFRPCCPSARKPDHQSSTPTPIPPVPPPPPLQPSAPPLSPPCR